MAEAEWQKQSMDIPVLVVKSYSSIKQLGPNLNVHVLLTNCTLYDIPVRLHLSAFFYILTIHKEANEKQNSMCKSILRACWHAENTNSWR